MIFTPLERRIALRYIRRRGGERFVSIIALFSILGIALGVGTLILVTSLMNGIRTEMESRFIGLDGHITVYANTPYMEKSAELANMLRQQEGVDLVIPKITGQVMVTNRGRALGAQVLALPADDLDTKPVLYESVESGSLEAWQHGEGIVLGHRLARSLGANIGDSITLISPEGRATIAGIIPRIKAYRLVATVKMGMHMLDNSLIVMPMQDASVFFKHSRLEAEDTVSVLEVDVADDVNVVDRATELQQLLGDEYQVYDWQRSNASIFQAITIQRNVMVVILGLIVVVAAFNIISSLIMLVKDKTQAIAILRTIGMTRRAVMRLFMFSGLVVGTIGTSIGVVLGLFFATFLEDLRALLERLTGQEILVEEIYFLSTLPTEIRPMEVILIACLALGLAFMATIYPAWRAANLDPVKALRHE